MRRNYRRLILLTFAHHGPLTDAELAWWACDVLRVKRATALRWRQKLVGEGVVREIRDRVKRAANGRLHKIWELAPRRHYKIIENKRPNFNE